MKALVKTKPGITDLEILEIPKPECPDNGVLLKVRTVAICGSDIHYYTYKEPMPLPQIMGHEFCGDIVEVGKDVKGWKVGDFVITRVPVYYCNKCVYCKSGDFDKCTNKGIAGLTAPGAYTEYIVSFPDRLYLVPEGVSEEMAACAEPSTIALHAVKRFGIKEGDTCVVAGMGIIGLLTLQFLKLYGAKEIIVVGMDSDKAKRWELAQKYGATKFINAQEGPASKQILEYTNGFKVDVAIDCVGVVSAIEDLFNVVKARGTIGAIGVPPTDTIIGINWYKMVWESVNIISSFGSDPEDWEDVVNYMADGRLYFQDAITHQLGFGDWEVIFKNPHNPDYVKAVMKPGL